jgi:hypothetical protein
MRFHLTEALAFIDHSDLLEISGDSDGVLSYSRGEEIFMKDSIQNYLRWFRPK